MPMPVFPSKAEIVWVFLRIGPKEVAHYVYTLDPQIIYLVLGPNGRI